MGPVWINYCQWLQHSNSICVRQPMFIDHCPWSFLTLLGQSEGRTTRLISDSWLYTIQTHTKGLRDMLCHGKYILLQLAHLTLLMASRHVHKPFCSLIRRKCHCLDLCLKGPLWTETESTPLSTGAPCLSPSLSLSTRYFSWSLNSSIIAFPVLSRTRGGLLN